MEESAKPKILERDVLPSKERAENLLLEKKTEKEPVKEKEIEKSTLNEAAQKIESSLKFLKRTKKQASNHSLVKNAVATRVEKIMEDGLRETYEQLSPIAKQEFKIKGENTANAIAEILQSAHIQAKKIFLLILEWLKLLPGVNRFFLEQEAKIKTDKILELKK